MRTVFVKSKHPHKAGCRAGIAVYFEAISIDPRTQPGFSVFHEKPCNLLSKELVCNFLLFRQVSDNVLNFYQNEKHILQSNVLSTVLKTSSDNTKKRIYFYMCCGVQNNTGQSKDLENVSIKGSYAFADVNNPEKIKDEKELRKLVEGHSLVSLQLNSTLGKQYLCCIVIGLSHKKLSATTKDFGMFKPLDSDWQLPDGKDIDILLVVPIKADQNAGKKYSAVVYKLVVHGITFYNINKLE